MLSTAESTESENVVTPDLCYIKSLVVLGRTQGPFRIIAVPVIYCNRASFNQSGKDCQSGCHCHQVLSFALVLAITFGSVTAGVSEGSGSSGAKGNCKSLVIQTHWLCLEEATSDGP